MKLFTIALLTFLSSNALADYLGEWEPETVLEKIKAGKVVILDVRSSKEYTEGHVPSAINIPYNAIKENLHKLAGFKGKEIVIYCRSGRRAGWAEETLTEQGFKKLYHLKGDMNGWEAANLKVEK